MIVVIAVTALITAIAATAMLAATRSHHIAATRPPTVPETVATAVRRHDPAVTWLNTMPGGCKADCDCQRRDGRIDGYGKRPTWQRGLPQ